ncbi:MAG: 1-acyl-sn-glycerol-3-phosphate acyltransferase [Candidatus Cloacimonetes bacterium]|nr:1-acyl-sn-glycerol-3-phosphate acyltransferase [Candidatus Cloacimonadota bacterium]
MSQLIEPNMNENLVKIKPRSNYNIHHVLARVVNKLICSFTLTDCEVLGEEHLEGIPKPYMLVANHNSNWDPLVLGAYFPDILNFMVKEELHDMPAFGAMSNLTGNIAVSRGETDIGAIKGALALLKNGYNLALFPEGTRSEDGRIQEFKDGGVSIASKVKVPIVPVYIEGTYEILNKNSKIPRAGRVKIHILEPNMKTCEDKKLSRDELHAINESIHKDLVSFENDLKA